MRGGGRRRLTVPMYIPAQFNSKDVADAIELMKSHPFATLITNDDEGWPYITYLPLHLEDSGGQVPPESRDRG
jgi:predicted FMN-binding regulatory protein PaiB